MATYINSELTESQHIASQYACQCAHRMHSTMPSKQLNDAYPHGSGKIRGVTLRSNLSCTRATVCSLRKTRHLLPNEDKQHAYPCSLPELRAAMPDSGTPAGLSSQRQLRVLTREACSSPKTYCSYGAGRDRTQALGRQIFRVRYLHTSLAPVAARRLLAFSLTDGLGCACPRQGIRALEDFVLRYCAFKLHSR